MAVRVRRLKGAHPTLPDNSAPPHAPAPFFISYSAALGALRGVAVVATIVHTGHRRRLKPGGCPRVACVPCCSAGPTARRAAATGVVGWWRRRGPFSVILVGLLLFRIPIATGPCPPRASARLRSRSAGRFLSASHHVGRPERWPVPPLVSATAHPSSVNPSTSTWRVVPTTPTPQPSNSPACSSLEWACGWPVTQSVHQRGCTVDWTAIPPPVHCMCFFAPPPAVRPVPADGGRVQGR